MLDFSGPIMGSLKSHCTTSYRSSIETVALNCLVFFLQKIAFFAFWRQDPRWRISAILDFKGPVHIFIYQNGSIQTKSSIKNTLITHYVHLQSITILTKCIDRIVVFINKFLTL